MGRLSIFGGDGSEVTDINISESGGVLTLTPAAATDLVIDNTSATGSTILRLGSTDNLTEFLVEDDTPSTLFRVGGQGDVTVTGTLNMADNEALNIGANSDFSILHDSSDTIITSATGNLTIDNTDPSGKDIIMRLGTDDATSSFVIQGDSGGSNIAFEINVGGTAALNSQLTQTVTGATGWAFLDQDITSSTGTNSQQAIATQIVQNTARSAGTIDGHQIQLTGHGSDTAGATYNGIELLATPNGLGVFNAIKFGISGWDSHLDFSSVSAGGVIKINDNLASALQIEQDTTEYLRIVTTDGSEAINFGSAGSIDFSFGTGTATFSGVADFDAGITLPDSQTIALGTGGDFTISHGGTDTIFDNTFATGSTIMQLGTDTTATDFQVQNDSGGALLDVDGEGIVVINSDITTTSSTRGLDVQAAAAVARSANSFSAIRAWVQGNAGDGAGASYYGLDLLASVSGLGVYTGIFIDSTYDNFADLSAMSGGSANILINAADDSAFAIKDASNDWLLIDTTNHHVDFGNATDNPAFNFLGSGTATFSGVADFDAGITLPDSQNITLGTGSDFTMSHGGTDTIFDNTHVTGSTIFRLGTTGDTATDFLIQDSSSGTKYQMYPTGHCIQTNSRDVDGNHQSFRLTATSTVPGGRTSGIFSGFWASMNGDSLDTSGATYSVFYGSANGTGSGIFNVISAGVNFDNFADLSGMSDGSANILINATDDSAFAIKDTSNDWLLVDTTNHHMDFGNATDNPAFNFLGSGTVDIAGTLTIGGDVTVGTTSQFRAESAAASAAIILAEDTDNGTNTVTMAAPAAITSDRTITVPDADVDLTDVNTALQPADVRLVTLSAGAEATEAIPITVNVVDQDGTAINAVTRCSAQCFETDGSRPTDKTLSETGAGTVISGSGGTHLIFDTDANGDAEVSVTDGGASADSIVIIVTPLEGVGSPKYLTVTFTA